MILHLNTAHTWRGGEQQLQYLVSGLEKRKIPQIVAGQPGSELEKRIASSRFFPVRMRGEWDIFCIKKLANIIKSEKVKLIHAHTAKAHAIALYVKLVCPDVKLIVSRRVDFHIGRNFMSRWKYINRRIDKFLTVSGKIRDILIEDGVDPEKVITVYSGIETSRFEKKVSTAHLYKEFNIKKGTVIIGNVAALVDHKDQATLLKAVSLLPSKLKFKVFIVGEGELENDLKQLASALKIEDKVVFTGFRNDIPELYKFFHIFALTSKEEGLGTSVLDAMANSLPLAVTKGGGISEMVEEGQGGFLAEVRDSVQIARILEAFIKDPALRKRYGAFNKKYVERFHVKNTVAKTVMIYESLLGPF